MADKNPNAIFIVTIFLLILALAMLIPAIFVAQESPQTSLYTQELDTTTVISGSLQATVSNIEESPPPANVNLTIYNDKTGESYTTGAIDEGSTDTFSFQAGTIMLEVIDVTTANHVIVEYTYPLYIGWPNGAKQITDNINMIILILFVFIIASVAYIRGELK